jgi:DNA-binding LacI/PurR family transcriptional regulator
MRQPIRAMAERAAELLFSGTAEQVILPSELIERASTAPRWS